MDLDSEGSFATFFPFDPGPILEDMSTDYDTVMTIDDPPITPMDSMEITTDSSRLVIAIDFGTTCSSVAYIHVSAGLNPEDVSIQNVKCISNYARYDPPLDALKIRDDVPTELWYDPGLGQTNERDVVGTPGSDSVDSDTLENESDTECSDDLEKELDEPSDAMDVDNNAALRKKLVPRFWGFQVQKLLSNMDISEDIHRRLSRFKLLLDKKEETEAVREDLAPTIKYLVKNKLIGQETDIYTHFLSDILEHTKRELESVEMLQHEIPIEFVVCVPAEWPARGCRIMEKAMNEAVEKVGFGANANQTVHNLFLVSEPEAAAACILAEHEKDILVGRALDCSRYF